MMQILGHIFLAIIVSTAVIVGDYFLPGTFLEKFIDNNFIETFAGLVGFNIAAVIFLLGQLIAIEDRSGDQQGTFKNTRQEIKHNSYFLLVSFALSLLFLIMRPDLNLADTSLVSNKAYFLLNGISIALFYLAIIAIFEILKAVFVLGKHQKNFN